ncbi:hypothetical protein ACFX13_042560 [Malus domestica]
MFIILVVLMTFLTVSALSLYGRYVMTMVCAVLDHHKSVRLVAVMIEVGGVDMAIGAAGVEDRGLSGKFPT